MTLLVAQHARVPMKDAAIFQRNLTIIGLGWVRIQKSDSGCECFAIFGQFDSLLQELKPQRFVCRQAGRGQSPDFEKMAIDGDDFMLLINDQNAIWCFIKNGLLQAFLEIVHLRSCSLAH